MSNRRFQTAYSIVGALEKLSWFILFAGILTGIVFLFKEPGIGVAIIGGSIGTGLTLIISLQFFLVYLEIENNTRLMAEEAAKTNAMLAETLGGILISVNKIAQKEN